MFERPQRGGLHRRQHHRNHTFASPMSGLPGGPLRVGPRHRHQRGKGTSAPQPESGRAELRLGVGCDPIAGYDAGWQKIRFRFSD